MIIKTSKKEPEKFSCKFCNYNTCKLSNLERHFLTLKHKMIINDNKNEQKGAEKIYDCKWCGKTYKYLSGLCRHKNICSKANNLILVNKDEHVKAKTKAELYDNQKNDIDSLKIAVKKLTDNDIVAICRSNKINFRRSFIY
jgi:hypothetical protein